MKPLLTITATIALMALAVQLAYIDRGYIAFGWEWMIWMIPAVWGLVRRGEAEK